MRLFLLTVALICCTSCTKMEDSSHLSSSMMKDFSSMEKKVAEMEMNRQAPSAVQEKSSVQYSGGNMGLSALVIPLEDYQGQWFGVEYPVSFTSRPQGPKDEKGRIVTDEAYFMSTDGKVELYVYAPLEEGTSGYTKVLESEEIVNSVEEKLGANTYVELTIQSKDKAYSRTFMAIKSPTVDGAMQSVLGMTYKTQDAYKQYKDVYERFGSSLKRMK